MTVGVTQKGSCYLKANDRVSASVNRTNQLMKWDSHAFTIETVTSTNVQPNLVLFAALSWALCICRRLRPLSPASATSKFKDHCVLQFLKQSFVRCRISKLTIVSQKKFALESSVCISQRGLGAWNLKLQKAWLRHLWQETICSVRKKRKSQGYPSTKKQKAKCHKLCARILTTPHPWKLCWSCANARCWCEYLRDLWSRLAGHQALVTVSWKKPGWISCAW